MTKETENQTEPPVEAMAKAIEPHTEVKIGPNMTLQSNRKLYPLTGGSFTTCPNRTRGMTGLIIG